MSWSETQMILNRLKAGTRALPLLIIEDVLNTLGGKTLTITNGRYTHNIVFPQGESVFPVTLECLGNWIVSYTDNGDTISKTATVDKVGGVTFTFASITSWTNGTDADIVGMVASADKGIINLSDYWHVGDEREITLSAMSATGVGESHVEQTATLVLMNVGGKTLTNAVESGRTECSFVVGMKDCLKEKGYMNGTATTVGSWPSSARRTWCNSVFKNAIPQTLLPIFKQFTVITGTYNGTIDGGSNVTSQDYFAIAAEKELTGTQSRGSLNEANALTQFEWYQTATNLDKKTNGSSEYYFERSPWTGGQAKYCIIKDSSTINASDANGALGISPYGVI